MRAKQEREFGRFGLKTEIEKNGWEKELRAKVGA
jgi:hypothetical protein